MCATSILGQNRWHSYEDGKPEIVNGHSIHFIFHSNSIHIIIHFVQAEIVKQADFNMRSLIIIDAS
jgi:hypothetical protein